jgi:hypothetical protein
MFASLQPVSQTTEGGGGNVDERWFWNRRRDLQSVHTRRIEVLRIVAKQCLWIEVEIFGTAVASWSAVKAIDKGTAGARVIKEVLIACAVYWRWGSNASACQRN